MQESWMGSLVGLGIVFLMFFPVVVTHTILFIHSLSQSLRTAELLSGGGRQLKKQSLRRCAPIRVKCKTKVPHGDLHRAIVRLASQAKKRRRGVTVSLRTKEYIFVLEAGVLTVDKRSANY